MDAAHPSTSLTCFLLLFLQCGAKRDEATQQEAVSGSHYHLWEQEARKSSLSSHRAKWKNLSAKVKEEEAAMIKFRALIPADYAPVCARVRHAAVTVRVHEA